jgi:hypothetical protein
MLSGVEAWLFFSPAKKEIPESVVRFFDPTRLFLPCLQNVCRVFLYTIILFPPLSEVPMPQPKTTFARVHF